MKRNKQQLKNNNSSEPNKAVSVSLKVQPRCLWIHQHESPTEHRHVWARAHISLDSSYIGELN